MKDAMFAAALVVGAAIAYVYLTRWARGRSLPDDAIGRLIKPPKILYGDYDPALRERTAQKRKAAQDARRDAAHFETTPHTVLSIRRRG